MDCKKIQELLKTDYLDGEAKEKELSCIKEHLAVCPQCRKLEEELKAGRMIFKNIKRQEVPERVWQNIRDAIVSESLSEESSVVGGILKRLRETILAPRPVFAKAFALTVIIFVAVFFKVRQPAVIDNGQEVVAGYSLNSENGDLFTDLGTSIEEYFL